MPGGADPMTHLMMRCGCGEGLAPLQVGILLAALSRGSVAVIRWCLRLWMLVLWTLVLRAPVLWVVLVIVAAVLWRTRGSSGGCGRIHRRGSRHIRRSRHVHGVGRRTRVGCARTGRVSAAVGGRVGAAIGIRCGHRRGPGRRGGRSRCSDWGRGAVVTPGQKDDQTAGHDQAASVESHSGNNGPTSPATCRCLGVFGVGRCITTGPMCVQGELVTVVTPE